MIITHHIYVFNTFLPRSSVASTNRRARVRRAASSSNTASPAPPAALPAAVRALSFSMYLARTLPALPLAPRGGGGGVEAGPGDDRGGGGGVEAPAAEAIADLSGSRGSSSGRPCCPSNPRTPSACAKPPTRDVPSSLGECGCWLSVLVLAARAAAAPPPPTISMRMRRSSCSSDDSAVGTGMGMGNRVVGWLNRVEGMHALMYARTYPSSGARLHSQQRRPRPTDGRQAGHRERHAAGGSGPTARRG